jgi:hypothetical protein
MLRLSGRPALPHLLLLSPRDLLVTLPLVHLRLRAHPHHLLVALPLVLLPPAGLCGVRRRRPGAGSQRQEHQGSKHGQSSQIMGERMGATVGAA